MKSDYKILIAFILNLGFSIFELVGGFFINSVSIISDAVHDFGDAISTLVSYFLEKLSKKGPNNRYTYGYVRYSVLGAVFTNVLLIVGSILVIINAVNRFINPVSINYDGMILFAIIGSLVNLGAVFFTRGGNSLNQKAVNLHMLEDVLGWLVVLVGGIIIKFTGFNRLDAILSIFVSIFVLVHAIHGLKEVIDLFLEKVPNDIDINKLRKCLLEINGIDDIHHIHVWSIDGCNNFLTMHVVSDIKDVNKVKDIIKEKLVLFGINHSTIEFESSNYKCDAVCCSIDSSNLHHHH